ncbi:hypothetical protein D9619_009242 [Psilocybe cf. subviscida]|uniref:Uncharacterized protein n=1 Tax=Psilocybe cf. subviscida TaxID=2480587 RepID=A0A8H5FAC5_9AGAR|nr:hypothetical protein D9619_009242 [Psilocybe cf. subviscida]
MKEAWTHPKLTPFRLAFILTTGGLGIAKAVLVSKGRTAISTTVEWITGVFVALRFQFLGSCEYNDTRPRYLKCLFLYDCLGRSGVANGEPRSDSNTLEPPQGLSVDRLALPLDSSIVVTGYRLLVSTFFTAFGLAKILCAYLDFSSAMYTLDWIIAIPLTLGMPARSLRKFFKVDYSSETLLTFKLAFIAPFCYWIKYWSGALRAVLSYSDYPAPSHDDTQDSVVINAIFERVLKGMVTSFCMGMIEAGVLGLVWPIIKARRGHYATSVQYGGLLVAFGTLYAFFSLMCIYIILSLVFVTVRTSELMFKPPVDTNIALLERTVLCFLICAMICLTAMLGTAAGHTMFKLPKLLITRARALVKDS